MVLVVIVVVILPQHLKISHCPKPKQTARDWPKSKTCLIRQRNICEHSSMHLSLFRWQDWVVFIFCHLLGLYLGCRNSFVCRHLAARFSQPMQSEINKLSAAREALKDTLPLVRKDNYCWSLVITCLSIYSSVSAYLTASLTTGLMTCVWFGCLSHGGMLGSASSASRPVWRQIPLILTWVHL